MLKTKEKKRMIKQLRVYHLVNLIELEQVLPIGVEGMTGTGIETVIQDEKERENLKDMREGWNMTEQRGRKIEKIGVTKMKGGINCMKKGALAEERARKSER